MKDTLRREEQQARSEGSEIDAMIAERDAWRELALCLGGSLYVELQAPPNIHTPGCLVRRMERAKKTLDSMGADPDAKTLELLADMAEEDRADMRAEAEARARRPS